MKARQLTTRAMAGLLDRRPSRQATERPLLNSSVLFMLFIPCNIVCYLLLKTNNLNIVYRPIGIYIYIYIYIYTHNKYIYIYTYTQYIRYSLLRVSAVDLHLQEETPNTF
jgi:hypothetical protein